MWMPLPRQRTKGERMIGVYSLFFEFNKELDSVFDELCELKQWREVIKAYDKKYKR